MSRTGAAPLGLYIHWPFCASKCPYCDFNSHPGGAHDPARWGRALAAALDSFAAVTKGRRLGSIFFGGGTPSLMDPETAAALTGRARTLWPNKKNGEAALEITLEANPSTLEAGRFEAFRAAGVNRLSIGVQSFDDDALRFLGRGHTAREAIAAIDAARNIFDRVSFDLIYALPGQTEVAWAAELDRALDFNCSHLSLYQLTIEPGTAFHRDGVTGSGEDAAIRLFELTQERMAAAGLPAYEISNHARPGGECRHNLHVWRGGDYIGVGPGAHGRVTREGSVFATQGTPDPGRWLAQAETISDATIGAAKWKRLAVRERLEEITLTGLRLAGGMDAETFRALTGQKFDAAFGAENLERLIEGGFLEYDGRALRATPCGRMRLNAVAARLLIDD